MSHSIKEPIFSEYWIQDTRSKIIELLKDGVDYRMIFSMLQGQIEAASKKKHYCVEFGIDFAQDYKVGVIFTEDKPKGWSSTYIRDFLNSLTEALALNKILLYSFVLRHNRPALIEVGEVAQQKITSYDFNKPKMKIKEE